LLFNLCLKRSGILPHAHGCSSLPNYWHEVTNLQEHDANCLLPLESQYSSCIEWLSVRFYFTVFILSSTVPHAAKAHSGCNFLPMLHWKPDGIRDLVWILLLEKILVHPLPIW
jgi:hypothetical protein